jgi:Holliday junction resolvase RusA-like endonuclease
MKEGLCVGQLGTVIGDQLSFRLPVPPPSMNSMYSVMFALRRIELKPEVRTYKTSMKMYVPKFAVKDGEKVAFVVKVHRDWFCKNGAMKKLDCQNMQKVLVDLVSEKQGWSDEQVWDFRVVKVQDKDSSFVEVEERIIRE